jgi:hypothetical protein
MGAQVSNNPNIVLSNPNEEIIEYEGYEEFAVVEPVKNDLLKQSKIKPNPSMNNNSGGSSIGKYESEHNLHKCREKNREDHKENNEEEKNRSESKFQHSNDQIIHEEENKNANNQEENNNNDKLKAANNENNEQKKEEDKKIDNNIENNVEKKEEEVKNIEEQAKNINNVNEGGENLKSVDDKDKDKVNDNIKLEENVKNENNNKEVNPTNEEQNQIQKEDINNINNNNNDIDNNNNNNNNNNDANDNNNNEKNIEPNIQMEENKENIKENNVVVNEENTNEKNNANNNNNNKNDDLAPRKIILPNINTIISEKVLEEGAGNELLFMSNLNKMVHISIKERVKYSEKFCITTKDNFLIYETRENYIKVKKPLAIIPINSIKNVVLFKLTKKIINYDHFYIEFLLDENNKNNVYNQVDTFYINDLDNTNNENKSDTALVMFKTEEKNLAKKWYVLLKYLVELKSKN